MQRSRQSLLELRAAIGQCGSHSIGSVSPNSRKGCVAGEEGLPCGLTSLDPSRIFLVTEKPRLPAGLGFYDLRVRETRAAQAGLAKQRGISALRRRPRGALRITFHGMIDRP